METKTNSEALPLPATTDIAGRTPVIVTVNGGSSSIKFAVFSATAAPKRLFSGQVERIGMPTARMTAIQEDTSTLEQWPLAATTFDGCVESILVALHQRIGSAVVGGIGHRIVHGGLHLLDHQLVTLALIRELRDAQPLDRAHLPHEIALVERFAAAFPSIPQVVCFDTAFHRDLPRVAQLLPIPRRYLDTGVRRFGFHGLSYTFLMKRLNTLAGPDAANGRVVMAHLGSGASMAAVRGGKPIDTTMSFTPTSGLSMSTRPGDMDPGLLFYLMNERGLSAGDMEIFISQQCGMLGVSGSSSDMRDLLARRTADTRAAEAVALFCYQARKFLGAMMGALGGLDTLIFSGGIGEHSSEVRWEICEGLERLGIQLDRRRNAAGEDVISTPESRVTVRVIATDEEVVIAEAVVACTVSPDARDIRGVKSGGTHGA